MQVDDFEDYEFYDAYESHRPLIYKILLENGVSSEDLAEFDGWSTTDVLKTWRHFPQKSRFLAVWKTRRKFPTICRT